MWPSPVIFIWRPLSSLCVCIKAMWKWLCLPCITFFLNYVFCSGDVAVLLDFSMVCDVCLVCVCVPSVECVWAPGCAICVYSFEAQSGAARTVQLALGHSPAHPAVHACPSHHPAENGSACAQTHTHTRRHRYTDTFIHQLGWGQRRLWTDQECSKANVDKVWYMRKEMCACIQSWNVLTRIEKNWKDPYGKEQEL